MDLTVTPTFPPEPAISGVCSASMTAAVSLGSLLAIIARPHEPGRYRSKAHIGVIASRRRSAAVIPPRGRGDQRCGGRFIRRTSATQLALLFSEGSKRLW